jgi:hypothetical protein
MTHLKTLAISFAGTAIAMAIVFRVPFLRKVVTNSAT